MRTDRVVGSAVVSVGVLMGASPAAVGQYYEGFQEGLGGWGSIPVDVNHVSAGGALGAADGYMEVVAELEDSYLTRITSGALTGATGDYVAMGIMSVSFALNELAVDEGLTIHLGFGNPDNFWITRVAFDADADTWSFYTVDFVESEFVQVIGEASFEDALSAVNRLQFRYHDATIQSIPDSAVGAIGVDEVRLIVPGVGSSAAFALAGALGLRRRRW